MAGLHLVSEPPRLIRVLIAEDNRTIAMQIARLLETAPTTQFSFEFARTLEAAQHALKLGQFHVVLLDLGLPDSEGLVTFVRLHERAPDVPTVVCTGVSDEAVALEALRRGAQDYLVKGQMDRMALIKSVLFAVERKHAADKLRESEEMHRSLLESIPDIVCKVDVGARVMFANRAAATLGYAPGELVGVSLSRIVHVEDYPVIEARILRHLERASAAGRAPASLEEGSGFEGGPFDVRYVTRSGASLPVNFSAAIMRNRRDDVTGIVAIARDMREMRRLIRDLEASQEQLRQQTAQLVHTEKMTALGQLAAGVAHEMNQPLNAMKLTCGDTLRDLDRDRLEPAELRGSLEDVVDQIDKVAELVQHLTSFARMTSGRRELLDALEPVDSVLKLIGERVRASGAWLSVESQDGLRLRANPARLQQALMNVVSNARDAVSATTPDREKRITIRVRDGAKDGAPGFVAYEVADTGPGIDEEIRSRVFEPFFTTKQQGEGTGLGLSIVTQVVEEHGGRIEVESRPGDGTTIRLLIPAA